MTYHPSSFQVSEFYLSVTRKYCFPTSFDKWQVWGICVIICFGLARVCGELFVGVCLGHENGCLLISTGRRLSKMLAQHGWTCFWFLDLSGTIIYLYLFVAFVQISVPKSFESCDGFFVVFCSPYFTASPWQESLWRTTDIGNWALIQLSLKRISSKTGRLLWFQANIICEPYTQVISHVHLTSLVTWHKI